MKRDIQRAQINTQTTQDQVFLRSATKILKPRGWKVAKKEEEELEIEHTQVHVTIKIIMHT